MYDKIDIDTIEEISVVDVESILRNNLMKLKRKLEEIEDNEDFLRERVKILKEFSDNQPKQRTAGWFAMRKGLITASDVGSCLTKTSSICDSYIKAFHLERKFTKSYTNYCNPYSNLQEFLLKKKGYIKFESNVFTTWGNKYEDCANRFYENISQERVLEFGLLFHENIKWLACSPDGITEDGKMLEIKCPYKRNINGIPPFYYWIQVQIQLEVANLDECDYLECVIEPIEEKDFVSLKSETTFVYNTPEGRKEEKKLMRNQGLLISINEKTFLYPGRKYQTRDELVKWAEKKCEKYEKLKPVVQYYRVKSYSLVNVKRDKKWFESAKEQLEKVNDKIKNFDVNEHKDYFKKKEAMKEEQNEKALTLFPSLLDECIL